MTIREELNKLMKEEMKLIERSESCFLNSVSQYCLIMMVAKIQEQEVFKGETPFSCALSPRRCALT